MAAELIAVFGRLRGILEKHCGDFKAHRDSKSCFGFEGAVGPATLKAWKGKKRTETIPIAWTDIGKNYVSYHLMGVYGNPKLLEGCSVKLRARMQGKSCFNFASVDEELFAELDALTGRSIAGMRSAGFVNQKIIR